jgi:nitroreductase
MKDFCMSDVNDRVEGRSHESNAPVRLLLSRASAVKLREPAPSDVELNTILQCAVNAPDHGRLRPWRFVVIRGPGLTAFGDVLAEVLAGNNPDATPDRLAQEKLKASRAPIIIIAIASAAPGAKVPLIEQQIAVGAAVENLVLASEALGYGTMWRTGDAAYSEVLKKRVGIASEDAIIGFIYLGTVETPSRLPRATTESKVSHWPA